MAVTPDDVRHVAQLARLDIPEAALATYVDQLNGILAHMEELRAVGGAGAAAQAESTREGMRLRPDTVGAVPLAVPLESFAPAMRDGFFLVPRLTTHESGDES